MPTATETSHRTRLVAQLLDLAGPVYVIAVYPPYAVRRGVVDPNYTPWFVGHADETALDRVRHLARDFVPGDATDAMAEFCNSLEKEGFIVFHAADVGGPVVLDARWDDVGG